MVQSLRPKLIVFFFVTLLPLYPTAGRFTALSYVWQQEISPGRLLKAVQQTVMIFPQDLETALTALRIRF